MNTNPVISHYLLISTQRENLADSDFEFFTFYGYLFKMTSFKNTFFLVLPLLEEAHLFAQTEYTQNERFSDS
jgi:hypothetical protein